MKDNSLTTSEEPIYERVLNTVKEGISVIDKNLKITYQNEAIRHLCGSRIGENCFEVYRGRKEPCDDCIVLEVIKDGKSRRAIKDCQLLNSDIVWVEFSAAPFRDAQGNIIGAVESAHDVTEQMRLSEENVTLRREMERQARFENIITQSKQMKAIFRLIERIASTTSTVLITGESGTGKELIARAILFNSDRKRQPFVSVNCGAVPENLLESELFGHVKGAFTGAIRDHNGLIETANGGTLFLDEIGDMNLSVQVKLLRFLQDGECRRVGDTKVRKFDVRIIAATNQNMEEAVRDGTFREDLFFRLCVIPIHLPPLRNRREDIPLLATHLFQRLCDVHHRNASGISSEALRILMDYAWPGNVRELENVIEYALHLTEDGQSIGLEQLPSRILEESELPDRTPMHLSIEEYTKHSILTLQDDHTEEQIADILGISRKNLWEKRKRWDLPRPVKQS